jgi:hypothetical protein
MKRIMRRFRIFEISGVDSPAQKHADVRIFKRFEGPKEMTTMDYAKAIEQTGALAEEVLETKTQELLKRQPELSHAQAYSRIYTARENLDLAKAERRAGRQRIAGQPVARTEPIELNTMSDDEIRQSIRAIRGRNPYATDEEVIAGIENSSEERASRAAIRRNIAAINRRAENIRTPAEVAVEKRDNAMAALSSKAEEIRKVMPHLSHEQSFARAYKMNPELAKAERSASRISIGA